MAEASLPPPLSHFYSFYILAFLLGYFFGDCQIILDGRMVLVPTVLTHARARIHTHIYLCIGKK